MIELASVADVSWKQAQPVCGFASRQLYDSLKGDRTAVAEIVQNHQTVSVLQQDEAGVTADEACPSGNQELGHGGVGISFPSFSVEDREQACRGLLGAEKEL